MNIYGLQKLTLLDYPEKVACTVFTGGCNLRCPFCHNASLVTGTPRAMEIPGEELFAFLEKRRGLLDGVCVTGGEPLLQPGLADFLLTGSVDYEFRTTAVRELHDKEILCGADHPGDQTVFSSEIRRPGRSDRRWAPIFKNTRMSFAEC